MDVLPFDLAAFDVADDTFSRIAHAYDWRNYIRCDLREYWHELTPRERLLLAFNAQDVADYDVWTLETDHE